MVYNSEKGMKMAKLTSDQKHLFSIYREVMADANMFWAYCRETGITIVYQVMPLGNFVRVSIAYCSKEDVFKKKIGLNIAMGRWEYGESILLRIQGNLQYTICNFAEACVGEEVDLAQITPEDYWQGK